MFPTAKIMDTENKLARLKSIFPNYDEETLLEILIMCEGSVDGAKSIILENTDTKTSALQHTVEKDASFQETESKFFHQKKKLSNEPAGTIAEKNMPICDQTSLVQSQDVDIDRKRPREHENEITKSSIIKTKKANISSLLLPKKYSNTATLSDKTNVITTNQTITLNSKTDIESALPNVRVFKNFLEKDLADDILKTLDSQKMLFKAKQFYIAGRLCTSSQRSIIYSISGATDYDPVYSLPGDTEHHPPPSLSKCQAYIEAKVNEVLSNVYHKDNSPEYMIKDNWKADFCVGNYYPNNKSHLDWHSDKLTNIGPLATIASISFGANRVFRLRRSFPTNSTIYNIPLPHNTLLLMLPSTQELFKHCVPFLKDSLISKSDIVGEARFNLTFRMMYPELKKNRYVLCDICKQRMILRRLFKGNDIGYYVWMCMSSFKGSDCKGFKYADFKLKPDGTMNLETRNKSEATRWLSSSENPHQSPV